MDQTPFHRIEVIDLFALLAWASIPTVMFGGYLLLGFLVRGGLSSAQKTYFRAGHAHAGILLLMALLYVQNMKQTALSQAVQLGALSLVVIGILAQSGGFFLQMLIGKPDIASLGPRVTRLGAILLMTAVLVLVYGLITTWSR